MNKALDELMKIDEISKVTAELLFSIGIMNPEMLAHAKAEDIYNKIQEEKNAGNIKSGNGLAYIKKWITNAQKKDYLYSFAAERYASLKLRSFEEIKREVLSYHLSKNECANIDQIEFVLTPEIRKAFKENFSDISFLREINERVKKFEKDNKAKIAELKKKYDKEFSEQFSLEEFKRKYGQDNADRQCYYCKIKESEIASLIAAGMITTKRLYSRGRLMEVDRTEPNGKYTYENTQLCCYWCNNAKTDEFNEEEFTLISHKIWEVWKNRLKKISPSDNANR